MTDKVLLYRSIVQFLRNEIENGGYNPQILESIEVAKQCLESAFDVNSDPRVCPPDLLSLFRNAAKDSSAKPGRQPTEDEKAMAETLKNQGNLCMKDNKFEEAVACYSKAIELSPRNAIYYCNRAAAYSKLDQHQNSVDDCKKALEIDPTYSKAYGRMGIAYSGLGNSAKAVESYRRGLELDPHNENCKQNLLLAEERLKSTTNTGGTSGGPSTPFDLSAMMENPVLRNMACQLMMDPNTQNLIGGLMQNAFSEPNADRSTTTPASATSVPFNASTTEAPAANGSTGNTAHSNTIPSVPPDINQFLRVGQQFAQQLQSSNPQLVNQLRQMFQSTSGQPQDNTPGQNGANPTG